MNKQKMLIIATRTWRVENLNFSSSRILSLVIWSVVICFTRYPKKQQEKLHATILFIFPQVTFRVVDRSQPCLDFWDNDRQLELTFLFNCSMMAFSIGNAY